MVDLSAEGRAALARRHRMQQEQLAASSSGTSTPNHRELVQAADTQVQPATNSTPDLPTTWAGKAIALGALLIVVLCIYRAAATNETALQRPQLGHMCTNVSKTLSQVLGPDGEAQGHYEDLTRVRIQVEGIPQQAEQVAAHLRKRFIPTLQAVRCAPHDVAVFEALHKACDNAAIQLGNIDSYFKALSTPLRNVTAAVQRIRKEVEKEHNAYHKEELDIRRAQRRAEPFKTDVTGPRLKRLKCSLQKLATSQDKLDKEAALWEQLDKLVEREQPGIKGMSKMVDSKRRKEVEKLVRRVLEKIMSVIGEVALGECL